MPPFTRALTMELVEAYFFSGLPSGLLSVLSLGYSHPTSQQGYSEPTSQPRWPVCRSLMHLLVLTLKRFHGDTLAKLVQPLASALS